MTSLLQRLAGSIPAIGGWARRVWWRVQRRRLLGVITTVVWVPADEVQWALRGAEHRFFGADRTGRLTYLGGPAHPHRSDRRSLR